MGTFIGTIITGAIIGALARFFMRGRQNISILWTIICGAVGAAIGTWAATSWVLQTLAALTGSAGLSQLLLQC